MYSKTPFVLFEKEVTVIDESSLEEMMLNFNRYLEVKISANYIVLGFP